MDDKFDNTLETRVTGVEDVLQAKDALRQDNKAEHELTVKQVFTQHPALVWWIFYWAMAGVGWYVSLSPMVPTHDGSFA